MIDLQELLKKIKPYVLGWSRIAYSAADVSNPPTAAEIEAIFGTAAGAPLKVGLINDGGLGVNAYLCISDGVVWRITTWTKAL